MELADPVAVALSVTDSLERDLVDREAGHVAAGDPSDDLGARWRDVLSRVERSWENDGAPGTTRTRDLQVRILEKG